MLDVKLLLDPLADDPRLLNENGGIQSEVADPISLEPYRDILRLVTLVVIALTLVFGAVAWWYLRQVNPPGEATAAVTFTVNQGDTLSSVSKRLEDEGIISSAGVFRWYVARNGGVVLDPGFYSLRARSHMGDIMAILNTPPSITYSKVTFPEGFTPGSREWSGSCVLADDGTLDKFGVKLIGADRNAIPADHVTTRYEEKKLGDCAPVFLDFIRA